MRIHISLAIVGLFLAAFTLTVENAPAASPLGDWRLRYLKVNGKRIKVIRGSRITLSLQRVDHCGGNAGVNSYFGECLLTETGKRIRFPDTLGRTRKGGPPNLMRQENRYLRNLVKSKRYQLRNGRLQLTSGNKRVELHFRATS